MALAVTSFPVGWRKQYLEWFAGRKAHFYQALKLSLLMSRFQGYSMFYGHGHMFQGLSRPLSLPWGMRAGAGFKSEHQSSLPDFKGPGKMPLQCVHLLTRTVMHQPGFNPQGGVEWTFHVHLL